MKKILSVLLVAVMVLGCVAVLASCTGDGKTETGTEKTTEKASEKNTESESESETIAPKGVLKMGTNAYFKPYEYYEGDKIVGIDAEIAAAIAEKLDMTLEIVDMQFETILTAVNAGSVDFGMAGMTVDPDREKEVDFSISYANGVQVIIVPENSPITACDDLFAEGANYKIGVQLGTTGDNYATGDFGKEHVVGYDNGNNAVLALVGGSLDCVIIDNEPAKALVAANPGLKILDTEYANEDYAICVAEGNSELLEKINAAILALTEDGTIDAILAKYIH